MRKIKDKEILSTKWLNFCIYWRIPISVLFGISNLLQFYGEVNNWNYLIIIFLIIDVSTIILYIITFIFARNYTRAGYKLLYSLFIFETITYSLATANNGTFNNNNEYILALLIYFVVLGLLWFLPNHIYLKKRKHLFYGNDVIADIEEDIESENESNEIDSNEEKATAPYIIQSKKITKRKNKFCKLCGGKINENHKCIKCGKQYFSIQPIKSKFTIILIILFILSFGFNIYQLISIQKNNDKINNLKSNIKVLKNDVSSLEDDNVQLRLEKWDYIGKANFLDENVVFVIEGYGNYYYTYDCMMKKVGNNQYSFWAYNISQAIGRGYKKGGC